MSFRLAAVGGGLLLALNLAGAAWAATDTIFKYTTAKTGFYTIDLMAMAPDAAGLNYVVKWEEGLRTANSGCFQTGANLPQGATIASVAVWYQSGADGDPRVYFFRRRLSDGALETIAQKAIADDSATRRGTFLALTAALKVVDNSRYSYGLGICMGGNNTDLFHGARIAYTYTHAGD